MIVASKLIPILVLSVLLAATAVLSRSGDLSISPVKPADEAVCPSGHAGARLTGWQLNKKMPLGTASYIEGTRDLKVDVSSVDLPNGTVLSVFVDETRLGDMPPLADGAAAVTLNHAVPDGARIRVLSADRPIVSANLRCIDAPKAAPTVTPRSTPTPRPTQTPSPSPTSTPLPSPTLQPVPTPTISPTPSPSPSESPTPDPMPKPSPAPSPSPRD